jgi:CRP/FNR family transcriptional regulator, cyclic AMP receptor protein
VVHLEEYNAIRVFKADPDLVKHLDSKAAALAQQHTITPVVALETGRTDRLADRPEGAPSVLGYLVVDGLLVHRVEIAGRSGIELLGRGDVIIPRTREDVPLHRAAHATDSWEVLAPTQLAVLDPEFERMAVRWPGIMGHLFDRAGQRACTLAFYLALAQVSGVERRLVVLLWLLADRWGKATPQGVEIPLRLSHRMLGELVAARRPSVTTALGALAEQEIVLPREPFGWVLKGDPPPRLGAIRLGVPDPA